MRVGVKPAKRFDPSRSKEHHMPLGRLSARIDDSNDRHHLWLNHGTWWCHYTLNFDVRTRRVRRSLGTKSLAEAIRKRDALFERLATEGEWVSERGEEGDMPTTLRLCLAAG
jgi:ligand-binding sensor domain-containing protein